MQAFAHALQKYLSVYRSSVLSVSQQLLAARPVEGGDHNRNHVSITCCVQLLLRVRCLVRQIVWLCELCHCSTGDETEHDVNRNRHGNVFSNGFHLGRTARAFGTKYATGRAPYSYINTLSTAFHEFPKGAQLLSYLFECAKFTLDSWEPGSSGASDGGVDGVEDDSLCLEVDPEPTAWSELQAGSRSRSKPRPLMQLGVGDLLRFFFRHSCVPYLRMLNAWLYRGEV